MSDDKEMKELLLRLGQENLARFQQQMTDRPMQRPVYTEVMGAVQCQWCLELFKPSEQQRTPEELGALKTHLSISDGSPPPVICSVCFAVQMSEKSLRVNPMYPGNRLLLGY